jgi:hypothetical protein
VDVAAWLRGLGLEQYEPPFRNNGVDTEILLTVEDLKEIGVARVGDRRKRLDGATRTAIARRRTAFRGAGADRSAIIRGRTAAANGDVLRSGRDWL